MASNTRNAATATGRRRKRTHGDKSTHSVQNGLAGSFEDKNNDYLCPICFDMINEAHMTKCGHSFCHVCIKKSLEQCNRCPKCNFVLEKPDQIFANFLLNELILKEKQKQAEKRRCFDTETNGMKRSLSLADIVSNPENLDLSSVNIMLQVLSQKKQQIETDCLVTQNQLLKEFLQHIKWQKQEQMDKIRKEIDVINEDMHKVDGTLDRIAAQNPHLSIGSLPNGYDVSLTSAASASSAASSVEPGPSTGQEGFNGSKTSGKQLSNTSLASKRKKLHQHMTDLEQYYLTVRHNTAGSPSLIDSSPTCNKQDGFDQFSESLSKFTRFNSFRPLATLNYSSDIYNGSNIVSSIEFDRDCDYFAIAGVTKKIKVFEYSAVVGNAVDLHYPVNEMTCNSKISCITWSSYHKNMMASSDYEGTVTCWDAFTGTKSRVFQEHEKRCWSVDFNIMDPKLIASGSDDHKVKVWSLDVDHSVTSIETKANVCCVKFNPESRYHLAFGSADHCVHYYDLRYPKQALMTFKGHRKAVSYTRFLSATELVSASTDSQLRLWEVNEPHCVRSFKGHVNEKNFVGLSSDGDYMVCGSENNALYVYYKGLSKQLLSFKFNTVRSVFEKERKQDDGNEFVSAVTWKPKSNVIVAANSLGIIQVLELV